MSTAAQILRQAESLKASLIDSGRASLADTTNIYKATADSSNNSGKGDGGSSKVKAAADGSGSTAGEKGVKCAVLVAVSLKDGGGRGAVVVGEVWVTRQKLEDVYKRLLLMDLEYALDKKVEQDLWNHAFKNQITALQVQAKEKQNPKKAEVQANLNLFLETASGFYLQFLQLICSTFHLDLPFRRKSSAFGVMKEKTQLRAKITPPKRNSCFYICQYCLVHLGDIARYRQQTEQAQTYYRHAVNLSPHNGQPYNQLAILEVNRNNKLCSVFYYVRSLAVRHPFPAAATNLEKFYTKLIKDTSEFKGKMAQNEFVNAFLQFQALLHLSADLRRASYLCGRILSCLPTLLLSQTFSGSVLVQCLAITIFTLTHLRHTPLSAGGDTKGDGGGGGGEGGGGKVGGEEWEQSSLSLEEQKSVDLILAFTASVLELSVQHTPVVGVKGVRESPTLPAVQVLLDWLITSPDIITLPSFANSNIWGHLAKMLNMVQQGQEGKATLDLSKYDDVPLPEDTELRCFQPMEKAHSKYSFSRIPVDGFPRGVEEQVRCARLVKQGKTIADDYPELKMTAIQQNDPPQINFSGPLVMKGADSSSSSHERRAKQNVAMQAIKKQGPGGQPESGGPGTTKDEGGVGGTSSSSSNTTNSTTTTTTTTSTNSSSTNSSSSCNVSEQSSPKYLLGTVTSEPQFMKHGSSNATTTTNISSSSSSSSNNNSGGGRLQPSPQPSPRFSRRGGQSPHHHHPSPSSPSSLPGFGASPRVASPRPGGGGSRVTSPLPASQLVAGQRSSLQHEPTAQRGYQPALSSSSSSSSSSTSAHEGGSTGYPTAPTPLSPSSSTHLGTVGYQPPPPPPSSSSPPPLGRQRQPLPQHPYLATLPLQGPTPPLSPTGQGQGQGQDHPLPSRTDQGHLSGLMPLGQQQGFEPGMPGWMEKGCGGLPIKPGSSQQLKPGASQFLTYPRPYPGVTGDRFHGGPRMAGPLPQQQQQQQGSVPPGQTDGLPRMPQHYPAAAGLGGVSSTDPALKLAGVVSVPRLAGSPSGLPLNQEMLSALRLASQISHPQSSAMGPLSGEQQQQQLTRAKEQPPPHHHHPPAHHPMFRPPIQHPPLSAHGPAPRPRGHAPPPPPPMGGPFSGSPMPHPFLPPAGLAVAPKGDRPLHFARMLGSGMPTQGQEVKVKEGVTPRLSAPPIPMQGQRSGPAFPPPPSAPGALLMAASVGGLFPKEGGERGGGGQGAGYQALSPLTIQPPKSSPPDTRISSSFQGHAEGTPKPDKQELRAPEKREAEPVMHRMVMPVGQPGGEYSLFASSSPWSMPLHSSTDSKSMASSPLSSHDNSMRNSPVMGFEPQASGPYDMGPRHKALQGEGWMGLAQGHEEAKGRGQGARPANMLNMWPESAAMTPLERLLEQQRMQRQTDPH